MRRKHRQIKNYQPDLVYNSLLVSRFINYLLRDGKKSVAQKVFYKTMENIKEKTKQNPLEVFHLAVKNVSPELELKLRRIGGANYQVPQIVSGERKIALAFRWIREAACAKKGRSMIEKLTEEIISASKNEGAAIKKKLDTHRMAEANRAFAHFAR